MENRRKNNNKKTATDKIEAGNQIDDSNGKKGAVE